MSRVNYIYYVDDPYLSIAQATSFAYLLREDFQQLFEAALYDLDIVATDI